MATVPAVSPPSSTSACLAKATTPESPAQTGGHHLTNPPPFSITTAYSQGRPDLCTTAAQL